MSARRRASWTTTIVAGIAVGSVALAGCGGDDQSKRAAADPSASSSAYSGGTSPSPTANPTDEQTPTPSVTSAPVKDPTAPATIAPVVRDGKTPHPSQTARPATLQGKVTYPDGVSLRITGIEQGTVKARGPGEIDGPITTFDLQLTNSGTKSLDLSQVVVTLVYGDPGRVARPSYTEKEQDFAGTVKPGRSAKATYSFAVPVSSRDEVAVHVDFDAVHAAATFSGDTTS